MTNNTINIIGCGWLGSALGNYLATKDYHVSGSTTSRDKFPGLQALGISPYQLALGNPEQTTTDQLPHAKTAIILLSPRVLSPHMDELTQHLKDGGTQYLILASSTAVYPNTNDWVKEHQAVHQKSPHSGVDLLAIENNLLTNEAWTTRILRFGGLYGPNRHPGSFLKHVHQLTGPNNPVNLVHQIDCVRAIHTLLDNVPVPTAFNICADAHPSRSTFYQAASQQLGLSQPDFSNKETPFKRVDNSLFKNTFDFSYLHPDPLEDMQ